MKEFDTPEIVVPPSWGAEQDYDYYDQTFGADGDALYPEALRRIHHSSLEFGQVVDFAIAHLLPASAGTTVLPYMSVSAKLALLRELISKTEKQARLLPGVDACVAVIALRERILRSYVQNPESVWLYELGNASDWIVHVWMTFLDAFQGEFRCDQQWWPKSGESLDED